MSRLAISPKARQFAATGAAVVYLAACLGLVAFGLAIWRSYCEGFGCIGKGIAWAMWAGAYLIVLAIGAIAWRAYRGPGQVALRYGLLIQLVAGVALSVYRVAA